MAAWRAVYVCAIDTIERSLTEFQARNRLNEQSRKFPWGTGRMTLEVAKGLKELIAQWGRFLSIALEPITALFTAALIGLYVYSGSGQGAQAPVLIYVLITITSAILGGRITKKWVELNEVNVVAARGKSAVRSLQLQLRSIATLENTIRQHRKNEGEIKDRATLGSGV